MVLVFLIGKKSINKIDREIRLSNHISRFVGDTNEINTKKLRYLTLRGVTVNDSVESAKKSRTLKKFLAEQRENEGKFSHVLANSAPYTAYGILHPFGM